MSVVDRMVSRPFEDHEQLSLGRSYDRSSSLGHMAPAAKEREFFVEEDKEVVFAFGSRTIGGERQLRPLRRHRMSLEASSRRAAKRECHAGSRSRVARPRGRNRRSRTSTSEMDITKRAHARQAGDGEDLHPEPRASAPSAVVLRRCACSCTFTGSFTSLCFPCSEASPAWPPRAHAPRSAGSSRAARPDVREMEPTAVPGFHRAVGPLRRSRRAVR